MATRDGRTVDQPAPADRRTEVEWCGRLRAALRAYADARAAHDNDVTNLEKLRAKVNAANRLAGTREAFEQMLTGVSDD